MEFDLRETIRDQLNESASPDPYVIAGQVAKIIPTGQLREVLTELLPDSVRNEIRQARDYSALEEVGGSTSKKWQAASEASNTVINWRVHTPGGWKSLGACTVTDLEAIILTTTALERKGRQHGRKKVENSAEDRREGTA